MTLLFSSVLDSWDIELHGIRTDISIAGSPERCEKRIVIETSDHRLFILEQIASGHVTHRNYMAQVMAHLKANGLLSVITYLPDSRGAYVINTSDAYWQLSSYVSGKDLDRPSYLFDRWRGMEMAEFLVGLRRASWDIPLGDRSEIFSIKHYIDTLSKTIARREPELRHRLEPVLTFLGREFMAVHDELPVAFCHGDFHPLNIIWSEHGINGVIDWEFLGIKPEIYDLANLVGCLGMEDPRSLGDELVHELIGTVRQSGIFSSVSWSFLVEFIIALRFAWLSEWLRKEDTEMIELEMVYFHLLMDNAETLKEIWACNR